MNMGIIDLFNKLCSFSKEELEFVLTLLMKSGKIDFISVSNAYVAYLKDKTDDENLKISDTNTCLMSFLLGASKKKNIKQDSTEWREIQRALYILNKSEQFEMSELNRHFGYDEKVAAPYSYYFRKKN